MKEIESQKYEERIVVIFYVILLFIMLVFNMLRESFYRVRFDLVTTRLTKFNG